jgi:tetratricopeptide (TPR) repeat protein
MLTIVYPFSQDLSAEQHVDAAQQALQQDDFKQAIRHYRRATELDPQVDPRSPLMLSVHRMLHILPPPQAACKVRGGGRGLSLAAVAACAQNADYLDCLGAVLAETGAQEEAVQALQRAVQLQPDRGFAKYMCAGGPHAQWPLLWAF